MGFLVAFVLASLGAAQMEGCAALGGLFQRLSIGAGQAWFTLLSLYLLAAPPFSNRAPTPPPARTP